MEALVSNRRMALFSLLSFIAFFVSFTSAKAAPLSPEWGEWSQWTPCSLQCGAGISSQNRSCLVNCQTDKTTEKRYRSCCVQGCPSPAASSGNRCSQLPGRWFEATANGAGCSILCVNQAGDSSAAAVKEIKLSSGTQCQTQEGREGICLDSICAAVGCDRVLGSGRERDGCFQCSSSSNAQCQTISDSKSTQLSPQARIVGKVSVLRIPKESSFLRISHPLGVGRTRLALQSGGQYLFQGGMNGTRFQAAGANFTYLLYSTTQGDREELRADGPTKAKIIVQLLFTSSQPTATNDYQLRYSYHQLSGPTSLPSSNKSSAHAHCTDDSLAPVDSDFQWGYADAGSCSVTCGRGIKTLLPRCVDKLYPQRSITELLCLQRGLVKPPPIVQICNIQDCSPMWKMSEWSSCSGECGVATQTRIVQCEKFVQESSAPLILTDQAACRQEDKPTVQRSCNLTDCSYTWLTGDWSPCSELITQNLQYRSVKCQQVGSKYTAEVSLCDTATRPTSVRNCRSKNCTDGRCCAWRPQTWGKCDVGCGVGEQSRALECRYMDDLSPADTSCCTGVEQPTTRRQCWSTEQQNCSAFWNEGEFGKCTGRCCSSNQFKTRTVKCSVRPQLGETVVLPDEACRTIPKPPISSTCTRTDCPRWEVSNWGSCSAPNPPDCGVRIRSVQCMLDGEEVTGCCEEQPFEAEPCLPCNPTEPPSVCEGPDLVPASSCELIPDVCEIEFYRTFCCETCRKRFS